MVNSLDFLFALYMSQTWFWRSWQTRKTNGYRYFFKSLIKFCSLQSKFQERGSLVRQRLGSNCFIPAKYHRNNWLSSQPKLSGKPRLLPSQSSNKVPKYPRGTREDQTGSQNFIFFGNTLIPVLSCNPTLVVKTTWKILGLYSKLSLTSCPSTLLWWCQRRPSIGS